MDMEADERHMVPNEAARTRAGSPVRIYAVDGGGDHPVHGAWYNDIEGVWIPCTWSHDGFFVSAEFPRSVDIIGL